MKSFTDLIISVIAYDPALIVDAIELTEKLEATENTAERTILKRKLEAIREQLETLFLEK